MAGDVTEQLVASGRQHHDRPADASGRDALALVWPVRHAAITPHVFDGESHQRSDCSKRTWGLLALGALAADGKYWANLRDFAHRTIEKLGDTYGRTKL